MFGMALIDRVPVNRSPPIGSGYFSKKRRLSSRAIAQRRAPQTSASMPTFDGQMSSKSPGFASAGAGPIGGDETWPMALGDPPIGQGAVRPRLVLIDPKPLTRDCLVAGLRDASIGAVTAVGTVDEVQLLADQGLHFEAVIINLGASPFDAAALAAVTAPIRRAYPDSVLLLLTSHDRPENISAALQQGVRGYLTTDRSLRVTLEAIRFICDGWTMYPPLVAGPLAEPMHPLLDPVLTSRQQEVLTYLATGMSNKGIALQMHISESTVKAHLKGIMLRVGAANRTQVVAILRGEHS